MLWLLCLSEAVINTNIKHFYPIWGTCPRNARRAFYPIIITDHSQKWCHERSAQIPSTRLSAGLLEPHPKSCFFIHNREWIKVLSSQNSAPITQCNSGCKTFYLTPLLFSLIFSLSVLFSPPLLCVWSLWYW